MLALFSKALLVFLFCFTQFSNAQTIDVWTNLARTTFDSSAATLRIPCVRVQDQVGNTVAPYAEAYSINFLLAGDKLRLIDPLRELIPAPTDCLDLITVAPNGSTAVYSTKSAEIDVDAALNADRFYTLELVAELNKPGDIEFSIVTVSDRLYRKPVYQGARFLSFAGVGFHHRNFIYDDTIIDEALILMFNNLTVFEPGKIRVECHYVDELDLLELIDSADGNNQYRLRSTITAADNGKGFSVYCTAFNRDINRLEVNVELLAWEVQLQ